MFYNTFLFPQSFAESFAENSGLQGLAELQKM
jgi:hypothetical protein